MKKYIFGIIVILTVVFVSGCVSDTDNQLDGLNITIPDGYKQDIEDDGAFRVLLYNGNNKIWIYGPNATNLENLNEGYLTSKSEYMNINGINILFKKSDIKNRYFYLFNLNGNEFYIDSVQPLNESILTELLMNNTVISSDKIELSDTTLEEKQQINNNKNNGISSSSDSDYGGTEEIFTKNVLERYDSDGDGRISRSEWNTWCSYEGYDSMSNCDTNGDGYCSRSELNAYSHKYGY